jgi:hypothetical protein
VKAGGNGEMKWRNQMKSSQLAKRKKSPMAKIWRNINGVMA